MRRSMRAERDGRFPKEQSQELTKRSTHVAHFIPRRRVGSRQGLGFLAFIAIVVVVAGVVYCTHQIVKAINKADDMKAATEEANRTARELERQAEVETHSRAVSNVSYRLGTVQVVDQRPAANSDSSQPARQDTTFLFQEISNGQPVGQPRVYRMPGEILAANALTMTFPQSNTATGQAFRGRSVSLFDRFFTEEVPYRVGPQIDIHGVRPTVFDTAAARNGSYRFLSPEDIQNTDRQVWTDIWQNAARRGEAAGAIDVHDDAPLMRLEPGAVYSLLQRNSGNLEFNRATDNNGSPLRVPQDQMDRYRRMIDNGELPLTVPRQPNYFDNGLYRRGGGNRNPTGTATTPRTLPPVIIHSGGGTARVPGTTRSTAPADLNDPMSGLSLTPR
jgi:cell division protein FtsL